MTLQIEGVLLQRCDLFISSIFVLWLFTILCCSHIYFWTFCRINITSFSLPWVSFFYRSIYYRGEISAIIELSWSLVWPYTTLCNGQCRRNWIQFFPNLSQGWVIPLIYYDVFVLSGIGIMLTDNIQMLT